MLNNNESIEVRLTGENNYMRLHDVEGGPMTTRASHWRVHISSGGPGHVLFLRSDVTNGEPRIYADNIALARWIQEEISNTGEFADVTIPVIEAEFEKSGDATYFWTEKVYSDEENVSLTWYDFGQPFVTGVAPGSNPERPMGWTSVFVPARRAQLRLDEVTAKGLAFPEQRGDHTSSTAGLALSETWVRHQGGRA